MTNIAAIKEHKIKLVASFMHTHLHYNKILWIFFLGRNIFKAWKFT